MSDLSSQGGDATTAASLQSLYLKERRRSQIFMGVSAVLAVLVVASLGLYINERNQAPATTASSSQSGVPGSGSGMGSSDITRFFESDGSVDNTAVNEQLSRMPAQFQSTFLGRMEQQIADAVKAGTITEEQADELWDAFTSGGSGA